jgi:hypothetical protein
MAPTNTMLMIPANANRLYDVLLIVFLPRDVEIVMVTCLFSAMLIRLPGEQVKQAP